MWPFKSSEAACKDYLGHMLNTIIKFSEKMLKKCYNTKPHINKLNDSKHHEKSKVIKIYHLFIQR